MAKDDYLAMSAEVEILGGHGGIVKNISARISASNVARTATTISFNATTNTINDSGSGFGSFTGNRMITVSGASTGANNRTFKVTAAAAGTLTIDPSTPVTQESAGSSVTVTLPFVTTVAGGASSSRGPDETISYNLLTPICIASFTGNVTPRFDVFIDGTIAGTAIVRIANPRLFKYPFLPSLLTFEAHDE
jgi:hypothetical protein